MCPSSKKCEKGKDAKTCSPEQIKKCHGDSKDHPCTSQKKAR